MELEKLEVYQISMILSEKTWKLVKSWSFFEKDTLGKQLVRAADSVSANISEGYGRYHFNDSKNFLYFARGSLYETQTWLKKAKTRNLISQEDYENLAQQSVRLAIKLNNYIKAIGKSTESTQ
jgi:four helix bundle protein